MIILIYEGCWLPELVPCQDWGRWKEYENELYAIFKSDFIDDSPSYENKPVRIRKHPMEHDREEAFWHVTCCDFAKDNDRKPDINRCERIRWIRSFIENSNCNDPFCEECDGMLVWSTIFPKTKSPRVKILLEEERYVVIVEVRKEYCLLITAFYIDQDHRLRKLRGEYDSIRTKTGSAPEGTQPDTLSTRGR